MKVIQKKILWIIIMLFLTSCPEEGGNILDQSLFIKNSSNDHLQLRFFSKTRVSEADSVLIRDDKEIIYNFLNDSSLVISFDSGETREFKNFFSSETIKNSPFGRQYYLINIDTLLNYNSTTWDGRAGMKRYYLYSLEDFERINYTFVYP
jgi:hypothetical protein